RFRNVILPTTALSRSSARAELATNIVTTRLITNQRAAKRAPPSDSLPSCEQVRTLTSYSDRGFARQHQISWPATVYFGRPVRQASRTQAPSSDVAEIAGRVGAGGPPPRSGSSSAGESARHRPNLVSARVSPSGHARPFRSPKLAAVVFGPPLATSGWAELSMIAVGDTVGNYRVTAKLGEGGMGQVFLAEHPVIGSKVAIKAVHSHFARNPEVVSRFVTEARAVNQIGHDHIVSITDFATTPAGDFYFVMEYLQGEMLADQIGRKTFSPARAFNIAAQIADALQ